MVWTGIYVVRLCLYQVLWQCSGMVWNVVRNFLEWNGMVWFGMVWNISDGENETDRQIAFHQ